MKICFVAHGILPIPPTAYGAVEDVIYQYTLALERAGHTVFVCNERDHEATIGMVNAHHPDVVWIHDDKKAVILDRLNVKRKVITAHDPTFFDKNNPLFRYFSQGDHHVYCLSPKHVQQFRDLGIDKRRLFLTPNGATTDIRFAEKPLMTRAICLGMLSQRKRQDNLRHIDVVDFAGPVSDYEPPTHLDSITVNDKLGRYKGVWTKEEVKQKLTDWDTLVLISTHEGAPCVVSEALMAGLKVVVSEAATANLPDKPWIRVLTEKEIANPLVMRVHLQNHIKLKVNRKSIRRWAEQNLDYAKLTRRLPFLKRS